MTHEDIFYQIYHNGLDAEFKDFSDKQWKLYHFVRFSYKILYGGSDFFLYDAESFEISKYLNSFYYFGYNNLAELIKEYYRTEKKSDKVIDNDFQHLKDSLLIKINLEIEKIMANKSNVINWLENNKQEILEGLTMK